jgi:tetratricopeptide (TPR) repeat protein
VREWGYSVTDITKIPRLPGQYVDRVAERQAIEGLLREKRGARVAVYGLPGMGKTAMAAKLAQSVLASLAIDKVLWADLGQAADAVDVLRGWCQDLEAEVSAVTGAPEDQLAYLRDRLSDAVAGKYVLFVLDDVGDTEAAGACLIDDENCRYLLTTISAGTAEHFENYSNFGTYHLLELPNPEAGQVLERYAGGKLSLEALRAAERERLLRLGDGLPLGLMVLGRFLGQGLSRGSTLSSLLRKLDSAEALMQGEFGTRLLAGRGGEPASIDTLLAARWIDLPPDEQEALQTAAVFRDKPHAFEEAAWACILEARRASPEESEELAQRLGASLAQAQLEAKTEDEDEDEDEDKDDEDEDEDLQRVNAAVARLEPPREALMETGLLEQPVLGEPSFTVHSLIAAFLRTVPGFDAGERKRLHGLAARYYRGWLAGYQENQPVASPFVAAYRFENRQWLSATLDLCYTLREAGSEDEAVLLLTTLFFDAFWWWGELVPYALCDELLRMWQLARLGEKASSCLRQLRQFNAKYPVIDLERVPPEDQRALPSGYQGGTQVANFVAVGKVVDSIRGLVLGGEVGDAAAERDLVRLRMLTAIYRGEAYRVAGQFEQAAADYQEALDLLARLGQDGDDSDDWTIPYVHQEVADLHVRAGDPAKALEACANGVQAAVGDGKVLGLDLDHQENDSDHEVLGWLWLTAGDAHWKAGRLPAAWRSYAWACLHACTAQLWPKRVVLYQRPGAVPERKKEFGIDDYTVTHYKLNLATMLDRFGELWTAGRRAEACEGVRVIRETLAGGPDSPAVDPGGRGRLDGVAEMHPETAWEDCRDLAWQDTGLAGLALPLIPWERLTVGGVVGDRVKDQRLAATSLSAMLKDIWASSKWTLGNGPGQ